MTYTKRYMSPVGEGSCRQMTRGLQGCGLRAANILRVAEGAHRTDTPVLLETIRWLDVCFAGKEPDFTPPLHLIGSDFRQAVWNILLSIPYGRTMTYSQITGNLQRMPG